MYMFSAYYLMKHIPTHAKNNIKQKLHYIYNTHTANYQFITDKLNPNRVQFINEPSYRLQINITFFCECI